MSADDDALIFADEAQPEEPPSRPAWKVMIVDDEPQVHSVTRLALRDVQFDGGTLEFLSAYNGSEARALLSEHGDIALMLLDIVMETSDAGLQVADFTRNELNNRQVRIILRTGQPGNVPERDVINNYEINDYKTKTDLTAQKLFTVVMTALRSYRDLRLVQAHGEAMAWLIDASRTLFEQHQRDAFVAMLQQQLQRFLNQPTVSPFWIARGGGDSAVLLAASESWASRVGQSLGEVFPELITPLSEVSPEQSFSHVEGFFLIPCGAGDTDPLLVGIGEREPLDDKHGAQLLRLWSQSLKAAYINLLLSEQSQAQQAELEQQLDAERCQISDRCEELVAMSEALARERAKRARLVAKLRAHRGAQR